MLEDYEIQESMIGKEIIIAFGTVIPTKDGPDFVKIGVTLKKILKGSILAEIKDAQGLSEITIPKSRIQFILKPSTIATIGAGIKLPTSFRS